MHGITGLCIKLCGWCLKIKWLSKYLIGIAESFEVNIGNEIRETGGIRPGHSARVGSLSCMDGRIFKTGL